MDRTIKADANAVREPNKDVTFDQDEALRLVSNLTSDAAAFVSINSDNIYINWFRGELVSSYGYDISQKYSRAYWESIILGEDRHLLKRMVKKLEEGKKGVESLRIKTGNGEIKWLEVSAMKWPYDDQENRYIFAIKDVTFVKNIENKLCKNEHRLKSIVRIMQYYSDNEQDIIHNAIKEAIKLTESKCGFVLCPTERETEITIDVCAIENSSLLFPYIQKATINTGKDEFIRRIASGNKPQIKNSVNVIINIDENCNFTINRYICVPVINGNKPVLYIMLCNKEAGYNTSDILQLEILMDSMWKVINEKRSKEELLKEKERLRIISYYDKLTGIYNRTFFEEELKRIDTARQLPISLIIGDVNGLKMTNDVFGHIEGDKLLKTVARIFKESCRYEDVIARWGGDEFIILLPGTSYKDAHAASERIRKNLSETTGQMIHTSISLGYATKEEMSQEMSDILKQAENMMYRHKLLEGKSYRSNLLSSLTETMFEKSNETVQHTERMANLCDLLGEAMGLGESQLDELRLLALLHDIGKIAIPEYILQKPGALTEAEMNEIRKHPEIGYRIALASHELSTIAEYILYHHERWDGNGYPVGKSGKDIPLLSRMLAVIDNFDVMTHDRPYKEAMSVSQAIEEINRLSGIFFDPVIVECFNKII